MKYYEYAGLSYEGASREAQRLVQRGWFLNFERLAVLRDIMARELGRFGPIAAGKKLEE